MIQRVKKSVIHENIGGKEFIIDEQITKTLNQTEIWNQCSKGNIACVDFVIRRHDFDPVDDKDLNFPHKLYYVKIDGLGYIIAEDEIDIELESGDVNIPTTPNINGGGGNISGACSAAMNMASEKGTKIHSELLINSFKEIADINCDGYQLGIEISKMISDECSKQINNNMKGGMLR